MVESHAQACQSIASGIHAVPEVSMAMAAAQGAYRFLNNDRVTLRALAQPLIEAARSEIASACDQWCLIVHDWSQLMYPEHNAKGDRVTLSSRHVPEGYELLSTLAVSDRDGSPLAPVAMSMRAADGVHSTRTTRILPALSPLDEIAPVMEFTEKLALGRPLVHLIDAEADSVAHFREWSNKSDRYYLARADDRLVEWEGKEQKCSMIHGQLQQQGALVKTREVEYHGKPAQQYVAEVSVRLLRPGQRNRPGQGDRQRIPGPPLPLRLVFAEVRDEQGTMLAVWRLLTNVPTQVDASTIALWYYWRWQIEKFFKLLKSAGVNAEAWQQTTAHAIAARLLIASMACVVVWRLARSKHPQASDARQFLVRLSGRQMKRSKPFTMPAMLAGLWTLLAMLEVLEHHSLTEIQQFAALILSTPRPP
jgi:hypothetical protein